MYNFIVLHLVFSVLASTAWGQDDLNPWPAPSICQMGFQGVVGTGDSDFFPINSAPESTSRFSSYKLLFVDERAGLKLDRELELLQSLVPNSALKEVHSSTIVEFRLRTNIPVVGGINAENQVLIVRYEVLPMDFGDRYRKPEGHSVIYGGYLSSVALLDGQYSREALIPLKYSTVGETEFMQLPEGDFSVELPQTFKQTDQGSKRLPIFLGPDFIRALRIMERLRGDGDFADNRKVKKFLSRLWPRSPIWVNAGQVLRSYEKPLLPRWLTSAVAGAAMVTAGMYAGENIFPKSATDASAINTPKDEPALPAEFYESPAQDVYPERGP